MFKDGQATGGDRTAGEVPFLFEMKEWRILLMERTITVFRGDGIGPEITACVLEILEAAGAGLTYEIYDVGEAEWQKHGALIPEAAYQSFERTRILLKSPITTPIGKGFRSLNVTLRKKYDLYANIRPAKSSTAVKTPFHDIDMVIFRENTEDLYVGIEKQVDENTIHATKVITRKASERIIRDAFDYARAHGRKKVSCIHKANILKMSDGLFLSIFQDIARENPDDQSLITPQQRKEHTYVQANPCQLL